MSIHHLIFQNLKKNLKNYYLYVFALVFSAALYFAFVTMQYDPALDEMKSSIKGAAAIRRLCTACGDRVGISFIRQHYFY